MPQLGPAFLHKPIGQLNLAPLEAALIWLFAGMRAWAPGRFLKTGWKPRAMLYEYTDKDSVTALALIESSWAGETRMRADRSRDPGAPAWIALSPSSIFETTIGLPDAARGTLQKTIALRLNELSPIPPEDAAYAIGDVRKDRIDRIKVELAITRKAVLRAVRHDLQDKVISRIGASPDANGSLKYVFLDEKSSERRTWRQWAFAAVLLWCSLLFLAGAFEMRASKALTMLEQYEIDLRLELKALQETKENFALLQQLAPPSLTLGEAGSAVKERLSALPEGAVVTRLTIDGEKTLVSGLTPGDERALENTVFRKAEEYPGFQFFDVHAAHERENAEGPAP